MSIFILVVYFSVLGGLSLLGVHRFIALLASLRYRAPRPGTLATKPQVLVQLPLYNEAFVAERLLRAAGALRYPKDRLTIQVLDDSTDTTRQIVDRVVAELRATNLRIEVCRRPDRAGFKAGALAHGLHQSPGCEVVAIFDADFVPPSDFLERSVPILMSSPRLGLVQTRWGHLNRDASLLTRAQAVFLDGHFSVEHAGRAALGHPFNFNGTAGIWRRAAIEEAGGWEGDTITEDLDLSYRAQLAGWRFAYVHNIVAPAELPESWSAFRAQQARWVRGSVETARKLLPTIVRSPSFDFSSRMGAVVHLTNNFAYAFMALLAIFLPLSLIIREELGWRVPGGRTVLSILDFSMLASGTLTILAAYLFALKRVGASPVRRMGDVAFALCLGVGMSASNAWEVFRGLSSKGSEFVRTPKKGNATKKGYRSRTARVQIGVELLFAAYHGAAVVYALTWRVWGALPFLLMYLLGFATVGIQTAIEARRGSPPKVVTSASEVSAFGTRQG